MSIKLIEPGGVIHLNNGEEGGSSKIFLDDSLDAIVFKTFEDDHSTIKIGRLSFNDPTSGTNTGGLLALNQTGNRSWILPDTSGNVALESGVNFGPAAPASITVANGIITAIS